jgi:hypothetical protein
MLLWGVVIGALGALVLITIAPTNWPLISSRAADLRSSLAVLQRGGPLLLGRHGATGSFYAVGLTDDEGMYVYVPLLSRLFGAADPVSTFRYWYGALYGLACAIYPLMLYRLTRSLLAGAIAPLMLLVCALSMGFNSFYWIPAWGMLVLLPPIFLLARDWPRIGWLALVGISLAAGWMSSIRSSSGLGIALAAALVLLLHHPRASRTLAVLALLAIAYLSTNTFVLAAIRDHRDSRVAAGVLSAQQQTGHPFWHTAYIGLGYLPNDFQIHYRDEVAIARVQREAPGTAYLSPRYSSVLRKAYFDVVRDHPLDVATQYAAKALVTAADTAPYLSLALLTVPAMLMSGRGRRIRRRWLLLSIPAGLLSFLPSVMAIPLQGYEEGLYGTLGVVAILGLCWTLAQVESSARGHGGLRSAAAVQRRLWSSTARSRHPLRRSARASGLALVALAALVIAGHVIRRSAERWQGSSSGVLIDYVRSADL